MRPCGGKDPTTQGSHLPGGRLPVGQAMRKPGPGEFSPLLGTTRAAPAATAGSGRCGSPSASPAWHIDLNATSLTLPRRKRPRRGRDRYRRGGATLDPTRASQRRPARSRTRICALGPRISLRAREGVSVLASSSFGTATPPAVALAARSGEIGISTEMLLTTAKRVSDDVAARSDDA